MPHGAHLSVADVEATEAMLGSALAHTVMRFACVGATTRQCRVPSVAESARGTAADRTHVPVPCVVCCNRPPAHA